jgi:hypothetical protein
VSTSPEDGQAARHHWDASLSEVEAVAEELVALVEEFEARIREGFVPPAFAERLSQLRQTAERLFGP